MSKIDLVVPGRHICALRLFAAKNDVRFCLNGLRVEIGREQTFFIASDGLAMLAHRLIWPLQDLAEPIKDIVIPNAVLKHVGKKGDAVITLDISEDAGEKGKVHIQYADVTHSADLMRSKEIDWRKFFSGYETATVEQGPAQFNGNLMALFDKVHAILKKDHQCSSDIPHIQPMGRNAAVVTFAHENFAGAIAPRNGYHAQKPAWTSAEAA